MTSIRRWLLIAGTVCGAAFWLVACGSGDEASPEAPPEAPSEVPAASGTKDPRAKALEKLGPEHRANFEESKEGEIRYSGKTESGDPFVAQLGGDIEIPENFFEEISAYPEAVPFSMMDAGGGVTMVTLDSTDDASEIYEFYKTNLADSGWTLENDLTVSGGRILRALKDGRRTVVHIQDSDGGTRIGFMMSDAE